MREDGVLSPGPGVEDPAGERLTELLSRCYDDPDLFNSAILGRSPFWRGQRRIAESVVRYRVTVAYTGNAIGKDYLIGTIPPWWLYTRHKSLCIVTGPGQNVLGSVTWKEIRRACEGDESDPLGSIPLGATISQGVRASPLRLTVAGDWGALGYSTNSVERASGQHNRKLLVIIEEGSGVPDESYDAAESLKYNRLLVVGNPLRSKGRMVELIRRAEDDRRNGVPPELAVNAIRISSRESPHAHLEESPWGLADATWIASCERLYGKGSLWCKSHIDAVIPEEDAAQLIPDEWLDYAVNCERPPHRPFDPVAKTRRIACDLSEGVGRDHTAILVRDDLGVLEWVAGPNLDPPGAAEAIRRLKDKWRVADERISYDGVGIGRELRQHLRRRGIEHAIPYAGAGHPKDRKAFYNLRTECAWKAKQRLNPDWCRDPRFPLVTRQAPFHVPADENWGMLRHELSKLTYECVGSQVRLISKEDLCAELGRSPDRSDAFCQSFAFD